MNSTLHPTSAFNGSRPIYDPINGPGGYRVGARIARVQVMVASFLGASAFMLFCILRKRYPRIYVANFNQLNYIHSFSRQKLPRLPSSLFGWVPVVYNISEDQVLQHAGLDAVVFLGFFKMCIKALAVCVLFAVTVISPIRYSFTGRVDFPDPGDGDSSDDESEQTGFFPKTALKNLVWLPGFMRKSNPDEYESFLWMYTVFTYVFTFVLLFFLYRQTVKIITMRQQYLGKQCSITDRTIKISGIPPVLREEEALRRHINSLGVGEVESVCIVKEWNTLSELFKERVRILKKLETKWMEYFHRNNIKTLTDLSNTRVQQTKGSVFSMRGEMGGVDVISGRDDTGRFRDSPSPPTETSSLDNSNNSFSETSFMGNFQNTAAGSPTGSPTGSPSGSPSDSPSGSLIDRISLHLEDQASPHDSLSNSLMLNDPSPTRPTLRKGLFGWFGPRVDAISYYNDKLDVVDQEIKRNRRREFAPSSTAFITMNSVAQAQMLAQAVLDPQVNHLITSLAPSPHDILWENLCLTRRERNTRIVAVMIFIGFVSVLLVLPVRFLSNFLNIKSISKVAPQLANFLKSHKWAESLITGILPPYVFTIFNMIMPYFYIWITKRQGYTSRGDEELSSVSKNFFYIFVNLFLVFTLFGTAILTDTAQLAYQLADSLQKLSLFYVDLIILQGIGMFPYKLLLLGNLLKYPIKNVFWSKTPRNHLGLYKPPVFNFGLQLPQPILILIITVTYSVISTKILTAGLIYFLIGYFVFKYQLLYACVHPPHNTGKSYIPLSNFIALRSIENNELPFHADEMESLIQTSDHAMAKNQTLDERRELNQVYEYPNLISDMDGPLIAVDFNEALYMKSDGTTVRKKIPIFH
ncbi:hypothetical protein JCM33374_g370 [Metschnikowia sp. JCM 33374]|nr:hypothetical protein JCM33374_g370 [Metschnikowia sp. JCM 33374]